MSHDNKLIIKLCFVKQNNNLIIPLSHNSFVSLCLSLLFYIKLSGVNDDTAPLIMS